MNLTTDIQAAVAKATKQIWPKLDAKVEILTPPKPEFGDYSCPVALSIAKAEGGNPEAIANQIKDAVETIPYIKEVTVTKPGFVNFLVDYPKLASEVLSQEIELKVKPARNIVVEHTSVNPNKAAHVGHLRNVCLGDSYARLLKSLGHKLEVQNYIDDLGVQVADSVVAWEEYGEPQDDMPVDKWLWQIYAKVSQRLETDEKLMERRTEVLHEMEAGTSELAKSIVSQIVEAHLKTFGRFDVSYDLLVHETDIMKNHLWENLFTELKDKNLVVQAESGDHKGAWIVEFGETDREDKILVRSNGLPTYTAKDIAYQLWKFDQTQMPGYKRLLKKVDQVVNVIDERQSYPQAVLQYVLDQLGYKQEAESSIHLSYGVVKLSDAAVKQLDSAAGDGSAKSMSGRSGIGVMVDDLVDTVTKIQIKEHGSDPKIANEIAIGSIRYYMLKTRPLREIVFDFDEALRTDGNTGVYLQYAYARANNILEKANIDPKPTAVDDPSEPEQKLIKLLSEFAGYAQRAADEYDPSLMCDYAYSLATTFAKFYETSPVLKAEGETQAFRLGLVRQYKEVLGKTLEILGIPRLDRI